MERVNLFDYDSLLITELYAKTPEGEQHVRWPEHDLHLHLYTFANGLRHATFHRNSGAEVRDAPLLVQLAAAGFDLGDGFILEGITCFSPNFGRTATMVGKQFAHENGFSEVHYTFAPKTEQRYEFLLVNFRQVTPEHVAMAKFSYGTLSGEERDLKVRASYVFMQEQEERINMRFMHTGELESMQYSPLSQSPYLKKLGDLHLERIQQIELLNSICRAEITQKLDHKATLEGLLNAMTEEKILDLQEILRFFP